MTSKKVAVWSMMVIGIVYWTPYAFLAWLVVYAVAKSSKGQERLHRYAFPLMIAVAVYAWVMGVRMQVYGGFPPGRELTYQLFEWGLAISSFLTAAMMWVNVKKKELRMNRQYW